MCEDSAGILHATELNLELVLLAMQFLLAMGKGSTPLLEEISVANDRHNLVDCLLVCIGTGSSHQRCAIDSTRWSDAQMLELRKRAMALLSDVCAMQPEVASLPDVANMVVPLVSDDTPSGLRDSAIQLLVSALPASEALQDNVGQAGAIPALIELISAVSYSANPTSLAPFSTSLVSTTAALRVPAGLSAGSMQAAVLALSLLCSDHKDNQQRFGEAGGVACMLPLVRPRTDAALLHSVVECVWSAVVESEAKF